MKNGNHNLKILLPEFLAPFAKNGSRMSMNFLASNGSFICFDNDLKIFTSVSPGHFTNFLEYLKWQK